MAIQVLRNAFSRAIDPHPPARNANNVEPYTFVTFFSGKAETPTPMALRNTCMAHYLTSAVLPLVSSRSCCSLRPVTFLLTVSARVSSSARRHKWLSFVVVCRCSFCAISLSLFSRVYLLNWGHKPTVVSYTKPAQQWTVIIYTIICLKSVWRRSHNAVRNSGTIASGDVSNWSHPPEVLFVTSSRLNSA